MIKLSLPSKHGGIGSFTTRDPKAGGSYKGPFIDPLVDHQRTPTVPLTGRLHGEGSFECADHLNLQSFQCKELSDLIRIDLQNMRGFQLY